MQEKVLSHNLVLLFLGLVDVYATFFSFVGVSCISVENSILGDNFPENILALPCKSQLQFVISMIVV